MEGIDDLEKALDTAVSQKAEETQKEERQIKKVSTLSDRETRFIFAYVASFNKVQAYREAFGTKEHSDGVAIKADELLNRPDVERRVKNELAKKLDGKLALAPHWLLNFVQQVLEIDPLDYYEADGVHVKPLDEIPMEKRKFLRVGKPTINARTGQAYAGYELPTFSSAIDKLLEIVKLVTQVSAARGPDQSESEDVRERRERILNKIDTK